MKIKTEFLLPAMLLLSSNSHAFDWLFQPDFDAEERYTDNLRMQIKPQRDNFITTLAPSLAVGFVDKNQDLKASFKWNQLIFQGDPDLEDFAEKIADFSHVYTGERFKTELAARYAEQSSLNTQLEQDGSGNLQLQIPRFTVSVSPTLTYNLTEKNALRLNYNFLDVSFDRQPGGLENVFSYSDYQNQQVSITGIHAYSDTLSLNLSVAYSKYDSPTSLPDSSFVFPYCSDGSAPNGSILPCPNGNLTAVDVLTSGDFSQSATNLTYQAGFQYIYDEQTQIAASAGLRDTETTTEFNQTTTYNPQLIPNSSVSTTDSSSGNGFVFSANLNRNSDWGNLILNADQQINPSSNGRQQQTTSFSANLKYVLTERWTTGFDARYQLTESSTNAESENINNSRTYYTVTPNLRWNWTPEINLKLSYSYRHQQFDTRDDPSVGNNVMFQFSYQPQINRLVK